MNTHTQMQTLTRTCTPAALNDAELNMVVGGNFVGDAIHGIHHGLKSGMDSFFDSRHLKELGHFLSHGGGQSKYGDKLVRKIGDSLMK